MAASVLGSPKPATGSPIKIGLFNAEGGSVLDLPNIGDSAVAAADYANNYLGGLSGHRIEVVRCADKVDGVSATNCGNQFASDGVAAVVIGLGAQTDMMIPPVKKAGIPYFGTGVNSPLETSTPGLFFLTAGITGDIAAMAGYSKEKGYKKVAILTLQNPQALNTINLLKPKFASRGITVSETIVPQGTPDATPQVTAGLANKPDAVVVIADPTTCQSLFAGLQTAGFTGGKMIIDACLSSSMIQAIGSSGINGTAVFSGTATYAPGNESNLYNAVMSKYYPSDSKVGATYNGYVSMLGLIRAVNASGTKSVPTPSTIQSALKSSKNVPEPLGNGKTFGCGVSALAGNSVVKSTICSPYIFVSKMKGTNYGTSYQSINLKTIFQSAG
ncbi:MAG TPA: ABC transporter substrate-binding protein [Acidimicrobiales bacterium]|nr:ABC transporter substrate-binding protein [Acidimicrobiales bacterium]